MRSRKGPDSAPLPKPGVLSTGTHPSGTAYQPRTRRADCAVTSGCLQPGLATRLDFPPDNQPTMGSRPTTSSLCSPAPNAIPYFLFLRPQAADDSPPQAPSPESCGQNFRNFLYSSRPPLVTGAPAWRSSPNPADRSPETRQVPYFRAPPARSAMARLRRLCTNH
jgi:hypothetical protein